MTLPNSSADRTAKASAVRAAQDRRERNRRVGLVAAILIALGAIVAGGVWYTSGSGDSPATTSSAPVGAGAGGVAVGQTSAPTKVVIYEDFQCPFCRQLEEQTRDFLRENAAAGKVQVEYRPINLLADLPYSARAMNAFAAVLEHGTPSQALKLHDLLFEHQPYESDSAGMTSDDIAELVREAGASDPAVTAAIAEGATDFFKGAQQDMMARGIQGTPTVFVNNEQLTGAGVPDLVAAIEDAVDNG